MDLVGFDQDVGERRLMDVALVVVDLAASDQRSLRRHLSSILRSSAPVKATYARGLSRDSCISPRTPAIRLISHFTPSPELHRLPSRYGISASAPALTPDLSPSHPDLLHSLSFLALPTP